MRTTLVLPYKKYCLDQLPAFTFVKVSLKGKAFTFDGVPPGKVAGVVAVAAVIVAVVVASTAVGVAGVVVVIVTVQIARIKRARR